MGVGHPLGRAGGARGETQPRRRGLLEAAPRHVFVRLCQKGLERSGNRAGARRGRRPLPAEGQDMPKRRRTGGDPAGQWRQVGAGDQDPGPGLADHVRQLRLGQARVQRVADRAHAHDAVPDLDMFLGVPGQGGDPVAHAHAKGPKHARDADGPRLQSGVSDPLDLSVPQRRDDLGVGTPFGGVNQEPVDGQAIGLHLAVDHGHAGVSAGRGGDRTPKFQFHGIPPATRRRQTTASCISNMPGISRWRTTGPSSKAM